MAPMSFLQILAVIALVVVIGCNTEPHVDPATALPKAESKFDYFDFEVRSLEAQLKTNNETFWIDGGSKQLSREEAQQALADARLELSAAKLEVERLSEEIEADLTAGE
jgi:hypothetical protein